MKKVAVCLTVKNEDIEKMVKLLDRQTVKADEIVIVDAGDGNLFLHKKIKVNHIQKVCNRSEGRNLCAKEATSENLVFLDAGCVPEKNWLEEMKKEMAKRGAQIVAGNYQSKKQNFADYLIARFLNRAISDDNFIYPSARNFAIKKSIFLRLHGFKEELNEAEDLEFFKRAVDRGFKIEKAKNALVWWKLPGKWDFLKKIFFYTKGDVKSGIWWDSREKLKTHNIRHALMVVRYAVLIAIAARYLFLFPFFLGVYLIAVTVKYRIDFNKFANENLLFIVDNIFTFILIKLLTDVVTIGGFLGGLFHCSIVPLLRTK